MLLICLLNPSAQLSRWRNDGHGLGDLKQALANNGIGNAGIGARQFPCGLLGDLAFGCHEFSSWNGAPAILSGNPF